MLYLTFPNISHKNRYLAMIEEWKNHEIPTSPWALFLGNTYEEFLDIAIQYVTNNPNGINSTLFFFMDDEEILGAIQLRHHIDHPNCSFEWGCGGHIGYWLRPSARGKWLARRMLKLALIEARNLGIEKVLISANEDNLASWKTIEVCGWVFEKTIEKEGKMLKVYWITL